MGLSLDRRSITHVKFEALNAVNQGITVAAIVSAIDLVAIVLRGRG